MNREELAWAAGFFDGEGYIGAFRDNRVRTTPRASFTKHATLRIEQANREPLDRFYEAIGRLGTVRTLPPRKGFRAKHRPTWVYHAWAFEDVQMIVCSLWPWVCSPKKAQMLSVLLSIRDTRKDLRTSL